MANPFLNRFIRNVFSTDITELGAENAVYLIDNAHPFANQLTHERIKTLLDEYNDGQFKTCIDRYDLDICWRLVVAYVLALEYHATAKINTQVYRELTVALLEFYDHIDSNVPIFEQIERFKKDRWLSEAGMEQFFKYFVAKKRLDFPPKMFLDQDKASRTLTDLRHSRVFNLAYHDFEVRGLVIPGAEKAANATLNYWAPNLIEYITNGVKS